MNNRPLSKLAIESEVQEDLACRTGVYTPVHGDSSTESLRQFTSTVEFRKKSNEVVLPILTGTNDSCLTMHDIKGAGHNIISVNLEHLLLRPGINFLLKNRQLNKYLSWDQKLVVDASSLQLDNNATSIDGLKKYLVYSKLDGSKHQFLQDDILELLRSLAPDAILLPNTSFNPSDFNQLKSTVVYFSNEEKSEKESDSYGFYLNYNKLNHGYLEIFLGNYTNSPKCIKGELDIDLVNQLKEIPNLMIISSKVSDDGYNGIYYRKQNQYSILELSSKNNFEIMDKDCNCYTCTSNFTVAYLHHLFQHTPLLCQRLLIIHNISAYAMKYCE